MALTANCHIDPKKTRPFEGRQFHPFHLPKQWPSEMTADDWAAYRAGLARNKAANTNG